MSKVCRTCLSTIGLTDTLYFLNGGTAADAPIGFLIKTRLKSCVPEISLDLLGSSAMCSSCFVKLDTAYAFKSKCLETEAKLHDYFSKADCVNVCFTDVLDKIAKKSSSIQDDVSIVETSEQPNKRVGDIVEASNKKRICINSIQSVTPAPSVKIPQSSAVSQVESVSSSSECIIVVNDSPTSNKRQIVGTSKPKVLNNMDKKSLSKHTFSTVKVLKGQKTVILKNASSGLACSFVVKPGNAGVVKPNLGSEDSEKRIGVSKNKISSFVVVSSSNGVHLNNSLPVINGLGNLNGAKIKVTTPPIKTSTDVSSCTENIAVQRTSAPSTISSTSTQQEKTNKPYIQVKNASELYDLSVLNTPPFLPRLRNPVVVTTTKEVQRPLEENSDTVLVTECSVKIENISQEDLYEATRAKCLCNFCGFKSEMVQTLEKHYESQHLDKVYTCVICKFVTPELSVLDLHIDQMHADKLEREYATNKIIYTCKICPFSTNKRFNSIIHRQLHSVATSDALSFSCSFCFYMTKNRDEFSKHLNFHTNAVYYSCSVCNYGFTHRLRYKQHVIEHSPIMHKCLECKFQSVKINHLREHYLEKHYLRPPFKCNHCSTVFKLRIAIVQHILSLPHHNSCIKEQICMEHSYANESLF